jgi:hypothetical protein
MTGKQKPPVPFFWHNLFCMNSLDLRPARGLFLILSFLLCSILSFTQDLATVSFKLSFPGSEPQNYEIVVPTTGDAMYTSDGKLTAKSESDEFKVPFKLTDATRSRIFDLAKKAGYFERELDSKKKVASTGAKTLSYKDGPKDTTQTYNYSTNPAVQQLTQIFEDLSSTMEFGRRLDYYHHYQKLALDEELKRMEDMQRQSSLAELVAVAPIIEQIVTDSSLINPVRARAQRILAKAGITTQ